MINSKINYVQKNIAFKNKLSRKKTNKYSNYFFLLPGLVFLAIFMIYPIIYNVLLSFKNVTIMNLTGEQQYIGFQNYITIFKDTLFAHSIKNSFIFTGLSILLQFIIGFLMALLFNKKFSGRDIMRSMILFAWMMPVIIVGTLFQWMFVGDYTGIVNYFLNTLGIIDKPIAWLNNTNISLYSTIIANIWVGVPFNMIILLSGLQAIPSDIYEAANIDGANKVKQFFTITMPFMRPTILILLMLGMINTFKVFDILIIMTGGGPANSSLVTPYYAYKLSFESFEFSQGAAVSTVMFGILTVFALIYLWMLRREEQY